MSFAHSISSFDLSITGVFEYKVTMADTYYYSSGYVDIYEIIHYEGTLIVENKPQFVGDVNLEVSGQQPIYDVNSGKSCQISYRLCKISCVGVRRGWLPVTLSVNDL